MQLNLFSCVPNWGIIKDNSRVFIKWAFEVRVALNRSFLAKIELQVLTVLFSKMDHVVASMLSLLHKPLSPLCMSWSPCQLAIMKFKFNSSTTHSLSLIQNPLQVQIQVNFVKFKGLRSTAAAAREKTERGMKCELSSLPSPLSGTRVKVLVLHYKPPSKICAWEQWFVGFTGWRSCSCNNGTPANKRKEPQKRSPPPCPPKGVLA